MKTSNKDLSKLRIVAGIGGSTGGQSGVSEGIAWACTKSATGLYPLVFYPPNGVEITCLMATVISNSTTYSASVSSGFVSIRTFNTTTAAMIDLPFCFVAYFTESLAR